MTLWDVALAAWSVITLSCEDRQEDVRGLCRPELLEFRVNPEWTERIIEAAERVAEIRGGYDTERRLTRDLALDMVTKADPQIMGLARHVLHKAIYPHIQAHCSARAAELVVTDSFVVRYDPAHAQSLQDGKPPKPDFAQHVDASLFSAQILLSASDVVGIFGAGEVGNLTETPLAPCEDPLCEFPWRSREDNHLDRPALEEIPHAGLPHGSGYNHSSFKFEGGGTRFTGDGTNISFLPPLGGMLAHGGLVEHGADPVLEGQRYILAFFIDELSCIDMDAASRYKELARSPYLLILRDLSKPIKKANRICFYLLCLFFCFAVFVFLLATFGTPKASSEQLSAGGESSRKKAVSKKD